LTGSLTGLIRGSCVLNAVKCKVPNSPWLEQ
jgi:hypothetical protein